MNPDVAACVARLRAELVLSSAQATLFDRVARRQLVSVRLEITALLYAGVLLLSSGVGVFVVEHHRSIGPWAIAAALGVAAATCLAWVVRAARPFAWNQVDAPGVAFDYILLLGLLLLASDLAYVEAQFSVLGSEWPQHLLMVGVVYALAGYRWDSRLVLALALTTLAAWRGVSVSVIAGSLGAGDASVLRANAVAVGALYVIAAVVSVRLDRKAHFEDVFGNAGLVLVLGGLASGMLQPDAVWKLWALALLVGAGILMWIAVRLHRALYFAEGVVAMYLTLVRLLFASFHHEGRGVPFLLAALLGLGALMLISIAHRRMSAP